MGRFPGAAVVTSWWRKSLQFRTVVITVALTAFAVLAAGIYISTSIGNDLFQSRLSQVLRESSRAAAAAQKIFDSTDNVTDASVGTLVNSAQTAITAASSSRLIALYSTPGDAQQTSSFLSFASPGLATGVISSDLVQQVTTGTGARVQYWQSASLDNGKGGVDPGIIVGVPLSIPGAGQYQLYLGYSLSESEQTLAFVQQTLWIAGFLLTVLIALVVWVIVRLVIEPIRVAAGTSQRLASGDLHVRIPEKGEDIITTLARSFNGMADNIQTKITQLADLSLVQQRFVSDVSHELRTPLTTIRLAGDVLYQQRETFNSEMSRTAELLHTQTVRLELLLDDLLEISRFDAGSADLNADLADLVGVAAEVIEQMRPLADSAGSELVLTAPNHPVECEMDSRRIRRIISNLLGNAIEHGEKKPIVVTIKCTDSAAALAVRDHGIGISENDMPRVFERFWRADPSRKRTIGGTGLGLAISLDDALLHGGTLDLWSKISVGSCFQLTIPRVFGARIDSPSLAFSMKECEADGDDA